MRSGATARMTIASYAEDTGSKPLVSCALPCGIHARPPLSAVVVLNVLTAVMERCTVMSKTAIRKTQALVAAGIRVLVSGDCQLRFYTCVERKDSL